MGRYLMDQREWQRLDLRIARRVQSAFLIVSALPVKDQPYLTVYTAHSYLFDQLRPGEEPPQYEVRCSKDGSKVTVERHVAPETPAESAIEKTERLLQEVV